MKNLFICALSLMVAISFNSCKNSISSPGDKIVTLYETIKNKSFDKAAAMYVSNKGEKLTDEELKFLEGIVEMAHDNFDKKDGLDTITIEEEVINEDGNSADVSFIIHFKNGETNKQKATLNKFDGNWLIKVTNF